MRTCAAATTLLLLLAHVMGGCGPVAGQDPVALLFGRTGFGLGEFSYPRAAVIAPNGRLYVVDKAGRIQALTTDGEPLMHWRMKEFAAGKPTGLGVAPDGRIFAADTHYSRVLVFDADGEEVARFGEAGDGPGQFRLPTDVLVTRDGSVFVAEYGGNDRISRFSADLQFEQSFGRRSESDPGLERPQALCESSDGSIWVADACHHRICRYTRDGALVAQFGRLGGGPGELRFPYGLAELSDGTLVVCEYGNNRLQRFSRDGQSLGFWGRGGRGSGELAYPWSVVIDPADRVLVIDSGNNRVQVFAGLGRASWRRPGDGP